MSKAPPLHPLEAGAYVSTFSTSPLLQVELSRTHELCKDALLDLEDEGMYVERQQLKERMAKLKSAIAPYRKLPPELLSRIFEFTRDDELELPPKNPYHIRYKPMRVKEVRQCQPEHVCSFWRQVAKQTPLLLSDIWETVNIDYSRSFPRTESYVAIEPLPSVADLAKIARKIISRGTRVLNVCFGGFDSSENEYGWISNHKLLHLMIEAGLPQLEEISIVNTDVSQEFLNRCAELLASLPRLKYVTMQCSLIPNHVFPLHRYTMPHLVSLEIGGNYDGTSPLFISTDGFYLLLSSTPQLEACTIHITCNGGLPSLTDTYPEDILVHNSLKSLYIFRDHCRCEGWDEDDEDENYEDMDSSCIETMAPFDILSLPSLREFSIESDLRVNRDHFDDFLDFITRSSCHLKQLTIGLSSWDDSSVEPDVLPVSDSQWEVLIPFFDNIVSLKVPWIIPTQLLQRIADGEILPRLQWCCLYKAPSDIHYEDILGDLFLCRREHGRLVPRPCATLKELTLLEWGVLKREWEDYDDWQSSV